MFFPMSWMSPWTVARRIWGLAPWLSPAGEVALEHLEGPLGGLCAHKELGEEEGSLLKPLAHLIQGGDQLAVDDVQNVPALFGQGLGLGGGRLLKALAHGVAEGGLARGSGGGRGGGGRGGSGRRRGRGGDVLDGLHVGLALAVQPLEGPVGVVGPHHGPALGVDDGPVQPRLEGLGEEALVEHLPLGQAEGHVGHPQGGFHPKLRLGPADGLQGDLGVVPAGAYRHGQAVQQKLLAGGCPWPPPGEGFSGRWPGGPPRSAGMPLSSRVRAHHGRRRTSSPGGGWRPGSPPCRSPS